jgi:hypothetical protein
MARERTTARNAEPPGESAADGPPDGYPDVGGEAVVRRTPSGWRVGSDEVPDLTCAMVLADLLAAELPTAQFPAVAAAAERGNAAERGKAAAGAPGTAVAPGAPGPGEAAPPGRPGRAAAAGRHARGMRAASEAERLRATVGQLEHALTARVRIEQAIGVLAERHRIRPRQAFEQLRAAARSRRRRVIDIASDVVASATNPLLQLPEELTTAGSAPRRRPRHGP